MKYIFLIAVIIAIPTVSANERIVVSISDFIPIVKEIGGDFVEVDYILPPGSDPHSFYLTKDTVDKINDADVIILANSNLLSYEKKIKENYDKEYLDFEDYRKNGVMLKDFDGFHNNSHGYWLGIDNAIAIAKTVAIKLAEMEPEHAEYFFSSFNKFEKEMAEAKEFAVNMAKEYDLYGKKVVAVVPGVCYIISNLGMDADAILMAEGAAYTANFEEIKDKLENGECIAIVVPEFMKKAKAGEVARQLAEDTNSKVVYVKFSMAGRNESYAGMLYYNVLQFLSIAKTKVENREGYNAELIMLCISLALLSLIEGIIIYKKVKND
ncbi:hypothetical protein B6U81_04970 [Thermoplasmatales archaeon ex4484_30]|nr:MAG: hypothetical protein B6U81_04970 [Thermoplasmatales archaeon ex4484_30]